MKLTIDGFSDGGRIPDEFAFGRPDPDTHFTFADNRNPRVAWSDAPPGTRSFAVVFIDADVPADREDANKEGRTIPADVPRVDFFHWVLVDVPPDTTEIPASAASDGVTPRGKPAGRSAFGRAGLNDYTGWFTGDDSMDGEYGGYDGPGPPWNDEALHHYTLSLYALDVDRLELPERFTGPEALEALNGHVLAQESWTGTYAINPSLRG